LRDDPGGQERVALTPHGGVSTKKMPT
jgi:hypothetical protein